MIPIFWFIIIVSDLICVKMDFFFQYTIVATSWTLMDTEIISLHLAFLLHITSNCSGRGVFLGRYLLLPKRLFMVLFDTDRHISTLAHTYAQGSVFSPDLLHEDTEYWQYQVKSELNLFLPFLKAASQKELLCMFVR